MSPVKEPLRWRVPRGGPQLWGKVLASYQSAKLHDNFIRFCAETGCLDYAARRYRRRLDLDSNDSFATAGLEKIRQKAIAGLVPVVRRASNKPRTLTWAIAGILAALLALALAYAFQRFGLSSLPLR